MNAKNDAAPASAEGDFAVTRAFDAPRGKPIMTYALWIVQGLLALLFLCTGGLKLVLPLAELTKQMPLPGWFVRFLGLAEVLGAIGLILPGLLRIRPGLTPLAAAGLVIIMIGATVFTLAGGNVALALIPAAVGLLSGFVAYGRWRLAPHVHVCQQGRRPRGLRGLPLR
jgi:DoxX-like protein